MRKQQGKIKTKPDSRELTLVRSLFAHLREQMERRKKMMLHYEAAAGYHMDAAKHFQQGNPDDAFKCMQQAHEEKLLGNLLREQINKLYNTNF